MDPGTEGDKPRINDRMHQGLRVRVCV